MYASAALAKRILTFPSSLSQYAASFPSAVDVRFTGQVIWWF